MAAERLYLSPPHLSELEERYVMEAFRSNWIAPVGPQLTTFEEEVCDYVGVEHAVALTSGTAAIHLALIHLGVEPGDEVFVSTLTFAGSVNPICYQHAKPVFIDSDFDTWNMDPNVLEDGLKKRARLNRLPKAIIVVHLYGQSADLEPILGLCNQYEIPLIEDAAESMGGFYQGKHTGTLGRAGIFSFNGNKIITTSSGGMLVSNDAELVEHARKLSSQAREPFPHYEHTEIGYNYRMSNILAAIGRGQLAVLEDRVAARRRNYNYYQQHLGETPGIKLMPEAEFGRHNRWLTTCLIDPTQFGTDQDSIRLALEAENIESRPVWKPMHCQPVFQDYESIGGAVAEHLFKFGLCLPSGSNMGMEELNRVVETLHQIHHTHKPSSSMAVR